ncbi:MAG: PAS domain S-box protein [Bryobacteraceae bacterium]
MQPPDVEDRFQRLVESVEDCAIFMLDPDGRIIAWNVGAERLEGYRDDEILGRHCSLFYPQEEIDRGQPEADLRTAANEGRHEAEGWRLRKGGSRFWASVITKPIRDQHGTLAGFSKVVRDLTERKRSEEVLRLQVGVLQYMPAMAWTLTPEGRCDFVNRQWLEYTGQTPEFVYSSPEAWMEALHPEDRAAALTCFWDGIRSGQAFTMETRFRRACDGLYRWHLSRGVPLRDESGQVVKFVGTSTDIEELKQAEGERRKADERIHLIVDSALDAVVAMDADGIITDWNKQAEEIFGWTRSEAMGRRISETIIPTQYRVSHERGLRHFFKTGQGPLLNRRIEITALRRDGTEFPVELTVTPLKSGDSWTFSSFIRDISERKQAEEMRAAQARQVAVRADVSIAFGREGSLKTILGECAESIVRHLDAAFARIWTLSGDGKMLELQASSGMYTHLDGAHSRVPLGKVKIGMIAQERKPHLTNDVLNDPRIGDREWAKKEGMASFAGHPLIVGDRTLGVMAMFSRKPVTPGTAETLASTADVIAQGIERKIAEDRLRDSESRLRQLTETIPEMLWSAEVDGAITYCNQRVLDYTGLSAEQVHGAGWMKAVHQDDVEKMGQAWTHAVSTGEPFQYEFRCLRSSDGMYRWCVSSALALRASDGGILKWYGTVVDFHDRRQAQEDLRNTQAELAHVNRVMTMGELTASIAHEVSQPLAAIVASGDSCTAWLASEPPNLDKARAAASRVVQAATQASEIVQRVRALFKKTPSVTASVDVNELIEETISFVHGEAQRKNVSLRTELDGALPTVSGDRVQLEQVILNLTMNGIESMASLDSEPKRVLIRSAFPNPGELLVSVADTGPGIDAQHAGRLFAPFFTTKKQGIGMGLPISRSIIEAHGGRLWVANNEPRGAVFHFILPVKTPSE